MKILHINCNYAGTVLHRRMVEHLNACESHGEKLENCVYVPVYQSDGVDVSTRDTQVILSRCFRRWHRIFFDYKQSRIFRDIQQKYDIEPFDCIHAYTLFTDGNCARRLSRTYNIPYVVAVRSTDVNVFFKKAAYLRGRGVRILRDASAVFFLSENYRDEVLAKYVPENLREEIFQKSHIIPNGIDDFWLENIYRERAPRAADRKLRIIFAGVINRRKNVLTTQKALSILRQEGWEVKFTAVGRVEDEKMYRGMLSYPDTEYIPQQPKERLAEYYRENDLFVMPSHTETFGLVYAEAMSQGLPVIYTKGQGFDGQFPEGTVGFAVSDQDPADVADKIRMAAEKLEELSRNCLRLASRFDWADICGQYREIYEDITGR